MIGWLERNRKRGKHLILDHVSTKVFFLSHVFSSNVTVSKISINIFCPCDQIKFGGFKLGFWFAQQGSIYFFVIITVRTVKNQGLVRFHGHHIKHQCKEGQLTWSVEYAYHQSNQSNKNFDRAWGVPILNTLFACGTSGPSRPQLLPPTIENQRKSTKIKEIQRTSKKFKDEPSATPISFFF